MKFHDLSLETENGKVEEELTGKEPDIERDEKRKEEKEKEKEKVVVHVLCWRRGKGQKRLLEGLSSAAEHVREALGGEAKENAKGERKPGTGGGGEGRGGGGRLGEPHGESPLRPIDLFIHIDGDYAPVVLSQARAFSWPYGRKFVLPVNGSPNGIEKVSYPFFFLFFLGVKVNHVYAFITTCASIKLSLSTSDSSSFPPLDSK